MTRCVAAVALPAAVCLLVPGASARTWNVRPDGSGDAITIQAGIDLASAGDVVLVAAGTYLEADIVMKSGIILRSEDAALSVTIQIPEFGHRALRCIDADAATSIHGFTFTGGRILEPGGAIYCESSFLTVSNCRFIDNHAFFAGGGMCAYGGAPVLYDCEFEGNVASTPFWWDESAGGGLSVNTATLQSCVFRENWADWGGGLACGSASVTDCLFEDNVAGQGAGVAIPFYLAGSLDVARSVFRGNRAVPRDHGGRPGYGGGIAISPLGMLTTTNCTFVGNSAVAAGAGVHGDGVALMDNTIIAFSPEGEAVVCGSAVLSCCDLFQNAGGDWVGDIADQLGVRGNLSAWPLFCDPNTHDYHVSAGSPCLPDNNSCHALIGAFGQGCGPLALSRETWGRIKAGFR